MSLILLFVILTFVVMRTSRLIVKDTIFQEWRQKVVYWLANGKAYFDDDNVLQHTGRRLPKWRDKLVTLVTCPYCVSFDVAGIVVLIQHFFVFPLPAPIWWWFGLAGAALIPWEYVDGH